MTYMTKAQIAGCMGSPAREWALGPLLAPYKSNWPRLSVPLHPHVPTPAAVDRAVAALSLAMRRLEELVIARADVDERMLFLHPVPPEPLSDQEYEKQRSAQALEGGVRMAARDRKAEQATYEQALAERHEVVAPLMATISEYSTAERNALDCELALADALFDARHEWLRQLKGGELQAQLRALPDPPLATVQGLIGGLTGWRYDPGAPRDVRLRLLHDHPPDLAPIHEPRGRVIA